MSSKALAGMYRGTVVSVDDPENRYRVLVWVPSVTGEYAEHSYTVNAGRHKTFKVGYG